MPFGWFLVTASRPQSGFDGSVTAASVAIFLLDPFALEGASAALALGLDILWVVAISGSVTPLSMTVFLRAVPANAGDGSQQLGAASGTLLFLIAHTHKKNSR